MFIAIIGSNGFVGKNLVKVLKKKNKLIKVTRATTFSKINKNVDTVIHAANSSKKYEANLNPKKDFEHSTAKTKKILKYFKSKKIILISTISVRTEKNAYSHNRKICENLVINENKKNLVFRLPVLFNPQAKRGLLYDLIKNKKIYYKKSTLINPLSITEVCNYIHKNINSKKQIHEIGSSKKVTLDYIANEIKSKSEFGTKKTNLVSKKNRSINYSLKKIIFELRYFQK